MDRDTIIDGLRMTMDLFTFDPTTGEEKDPDGLNDLDRATYDACKGALEILERLDTDSDTISRQEAIDTEGLDAEIRCEMCKNPMRTDRGCDGHCEYDEKLYEKIMQVLDERIKLLPPAQPEIIQCRNCKFASGDSRICMKFDHSPIGELDFCAWAERREVTT